MRTWEVIRKERGYFDAIAEIASLLAEDGYLPGAGADGSQATLLAYFPLARTNPYQALLYNRASAHGVGTLAVRDWRSFVELPWSGLAICHFHWLNGVLADASSEGEADDRIGEFAATLATLREQGRKIVWTVHNVLPHHASMPEKEIEVRRVLVANADAVHVMTADTAERVGEHFRLPEDRVCFVPHPSYAGVYPDYVSRQEARSELGLGRHDFAFLLFGSIQPYKGLEQLMQSFDHVSASAQRSRPVLLVAGQAYDATLEQDLKSWALGRKDVRIDCRKIPADEVQHYFRAVDASVLPYRRALNSGAAMLSLTFSVPFVAPAMGAFPELVAEFGGLCYEPGAPDGLTTAMERALEFEPDQSERIGTRLAGYSPATVSEEFFRRMLALLRGRP